LLALRELGGLLQAGADRSTRYRVNLPDRDA